MTRRSLPLLLLTLFSSSAMAADSSAVAMLWKRMDAAFAAAERVPEAERRDRAYALMGASAKTGDERLDNVLLSIALRPQSSGAHHLLLLAGVIYNGQQVPFAFDDAATFLEQLYRQRAAGSEAEAIEWKAGLSDLLLHLGRFDEARTNQSAVVAKSDDPFKRVFLAVAEAAAGNSQPWKELLASCPKPPQTWFDQIGAGADPRRYCEEVASGIASRAMRVLNDKTPRVLADIAAGRSVDPEMDWRYRLQGLKRAVDARAPGTGERLLEIVRNRESTKAEVDDAIYLLTLWFEREQDHHATIEWTGCWLARRVLPLPALPADGWKRYATMALPETLQLPGDRGADCLQFNGNDEGPFAVASLCTAMVLSRREKAASNAKDWAVTKSTIETMLAISLASDPRFGISTLDVAIPSFYGAHSGPEAKRAVRWMLDQPHLREPHPVTK